MTSAPMPPMLSVSARGLASPYQVNAGRHSTWHSSAKAHERSLCTSSPVVNRYSFWQLSSRS